MSAKTIDERAEHAERLIEQSMAAAPARRSWKWRCPCRDGNPDAAHVAGCDDEIVRQRTAFRAVIAREIRAAVKAERDRCVALLREREVFTTTPAWAADLAKHRSEIEAEYPEHVWRGDVTEELKDIGDVIAWPELYGGGDPFEALREPRPEVHP